MCGHLSVNAACHFHVATEHWTKTLGILEPSVLKGKFILLQYYSGI